MYAKILQRLFCVGLILLASISRAQETPVVGEKSAKTVILPVDAGGVDAGLLFQSVADELHWTTGSVAGFARAFGVEATGNRLTKQQVDTLVQKFPSVFRYEPDPTSKQQSLAVETSELAKMLADKKSNFRKWLATVDGRAFERTDQS